jgi:polysaccharide export outer membrane protein
MKTTFLPVLFCILLSPRVASPQQAGRTQSSGIPESTIVHNTPKEPAGPVVLAAGDDLTIWALGVSEISDKPIRIDDTGFVDLPILGRVKAAGLTPDGFRAELLKKLAVYVQQPQVTVSVIQHSTPVSVVGSVTRPGVYQIHSGTTVLEVISLAGGLASDAGRFVRLTRPADSQCTPLGISDATASGSSLVLELHKLLESGATTNEHVCARDVVVVPRADVIYVVGEVQKAGAFAITDRGSYTVLQALSLAGGMTRVAKPSAARILRDQAGATRQEIPIDLRQLMSSKKEDIQLKPGDILFVPDSVARSASTRAMEIAVQLAVGRAIYR